MSPHSTALLQAWTGPLESPPLEALPIDAFEPAFEEAFRAHRREVDAIASLADPPTFENTIAAMERSGRELSRALSLFQALTGTMSGAQLQAAERRLSPLLAEHQDAVALAPGLYERVMTVHTGAVREVLDDEQRRVAERYAVSLERRGARLPPEAKVRLTAINARLATLYVEFSQNLLADEEQAALIITDPSDLAGVPEPQREAAAEAAQERGLEGRWLIRNSRSAVEPFLACAENREVRERAWRSWVSRGDNGNSHDNKALIREILALRGERAHLLGYATHANYQLADTMAGTPEAALELLRAVWPPALAAAERDRERFQKLIDAEGGGFQLAAWDWRYYAEKLRAAEYEVDEAQIKPYFQLPQMREATFWCAEQLYGLHFELRTDVSVYHPDVTAYAVRDRDGSELGLFYFDPYARNGKQSGAWMNEFRVAEHFSKRERPLVINVCNFSRPPAGDVALLSIDDVITLFHEFGHALHGLLSRTAYPYVAGTSVSRDFVEFPSQLHEHWALHPQVLARFARHYRTGEPMPAELIERVLRARKFNQGFTMVEFIASAWVDMDLHLAPAGDIDVSKFERESLQRLGMPAEILMRHRPPHFGHVFSSDGYSAGYYAYLWAQVLDHDGFAAFEDVGDVFDPAVSLRLREEVLERGNSRDPADSYRAFRLRDPHIGALLRNRGFT